MPKRITLADIKAANEAAGHYFFSRDSMRFWGDTMASFAVRQRGGKVYIERVRKGRSEGGASLPLGTLREVDMTTGHIGCTLDAEESDRILGRVPPPADPGFLCALGFQVAPGADLWFAFDPKGEHLSRTGYATEAAAWAACDVASRAAARRA